MFGRPYIISIFVGLKRIKITYLDKIEDVIIFQLSAFSLINMTPKAARASAKRNIRKFKIHFSTVQLRILNLFSDNLKINLNIIDQFHVGLNKSLFNKY